MKFVSLAAALCIFVSALSNHAIAQSSQEVDVSTFTLENGMEVVVIPQRRVPVVTHMLWYRVGSADEEQGQSGIAHFFEHLMFKATSNHETGEFAAAVKAVGGNQNAMTGSDFTVYFEQVPPSALGEMMSFEADRMRNLVFSDEAIETERQVVLEERLMRVDNDPSGVLQESVQAALFQNHPYGRPGIGWRHEIEALTREQLIDFYNRYYRPNNAVLVVAGDVDAETVRELAAETYGELAAGPELPPRVRPKEPEPQAERSVTVRDARVTLPTYSRSWFGPAYFSENGEAADALLVLSEILGGSQRSRLHQELVVNRRIAATVGAWMSEDALDYSRIGVYARPIDATKLPEVEQAIAAEIAVLTDEGVTEEELQTAKKVLAADLVLSREDQMARAFEYGSILMTGGTVEDLGKARERLQAVTAEDVREAARRYLDIRRSVAGYLLPISKEDPA